jgi:hypothetical protein
MANQTITATRSSILDCFLRIQEATQQPTVKGEVRVIMPSMRTTTYQDNLRGRESSVVSFWGYSGGEKARFSVWEDSIVAQLPAPGRPPTGRRSRAPRSSARPATS